MFAISPIDGRYGYIVKELQPYFSEFGLMVYRVKVEVEYSIELAKVLNKPEISLERYIYKKFGTAQFRRIKEIEKRTHHDVKAVEIFLRQYTLYPQWIHFGLTSQDINNTAIPMLLKDVIKTCIDPVLRTVVQMLEDWAEGCKDIRMLARTHGQPATPVSLGTQFRVFSTRLEDQIQLLRGIEFRGKFGGATGGMNAHRIAFPDIIWDKFAEEFLKRLGIVRTFPTTQIEPYDHIAALCQGYVRINTILIDLCRDIWQYISMGYFTQFPEEKSIGSSTMPHKVNPIDFENGEGNLGIANVLFNHFATKLPISRLQRDLTDSTVLRNIGVPIAHSFIAYKAILKGLKKLGVNRERIGQDLNEHWEVLTEAIQTILRREGVKDAYKKVKRFSRENEVITKENLHSFIDTLEIEESVKERLKALRPETY